MSDEGRDVSRGAGREVDSQVDAGRRYGKTHAAITRMSERTRAEAYGIAWFAEQMAIKLEENSHKSGWDDVDLDYAMERLQDEAYELDQAVYDFQYVSERAEAVRVEAIREAADVANFAFMIAYKLRHAEH